jgi:hypothetical protein
MFHEKYTRTSQQLRRRYNNVRFLQEQNKDARLPGLGDFLRYELSARSEVEKAI